MREIKMPVGHSENVSKTLVGKFGREARRWKGDSASYVAKHMWLVKHYGKASRCENRDCSFENPKRFEWANLSKEHKRCRSDYIMLCCSCHRKWDLGRVEYA